VRRTGDARGAQRGGVLVEELLSDNAPRVSVQVGRQRPAAAGHLRAGAVPDRHLRGGRDRGARSGLLEDFKSNKAFMFELRDMVGDVSTEK
jgi:hypothetical protein